MPDFDAVEGFFDARTGVLPPENIAVSAASDTTLTITTAYEDRDFLKKLAHPAAAPCNEEFFNLCAGRYGLGLGYLLTNGPYYLARWETGAYFRIAGNPDYAGPRKAFADTVWFYYNDDTAKMNEKLAAGTYAAGVTSTAQFDPDAVGGEYTVTQIDNVLYGLVFNCADPVTSVPAMRQALCLTVDRSIFSDAPVGYLPVNASAGLPAGVKNNVPPAENEQTAKNYLREGLELLNATETEITVLCAERHEETLKLQMQHWQKELGVPVNVKISAVSDNELTKAVRLGNYQAAYYPLSSAEISPVGFLSRFAGTSPDNVARFNLEEYDDAFATLSHAKNDADLTAAMDRVFAALRDNAVYLPLNAGCTYLLNTSSCADLYYTDSTALMYFVKY